MPSSKHAKADKLSQRRPSPLSLSKISCSLIIARPASVVPLPLVFLQLPTVSDETMPFGGLTLFCSRRALNFHTIVQLGTSLVPYVRSPGLFPLAYFLCFKRYKQNLDYARLSI